MVGDVDLSCGRLVTHHLDRSTELLLVGEVSLQLRREPKPAQAAMVKRALVEPATPDLPAGLFRGADVEWILSTASAARLLDGSPECVAAIKPEKKKEVAEVEGGSSDYYKGFLETPIDEFDAERDPNGGLDQALKLGGGATVVLGALFLGFMASNGLL